MRTSHLFMEEPSVRTWERQEAVAHEGRETTKISMGVREKTIVASGWVQRGGTTHRDTADTPLSESVTMFR